jgi:hypothetical protein
MTARPIARLVLLLAAGVVLVSGVAAAQPANRTPGEPAGWWLGAGGGYLAGHASCSNCESDRPFDDGYSVVFQGGARVTPRLLVGGEVFTTERSGANATVRDTYLIAIAQYRPFTNYGFFIKGGYGVALVKERIPLPDGDLEARTWGMGLMYGAGWLFRRQQRVSFAPVAGTYVTTVGNVQTPVGTAENVVINSWFAGAVLMIR